MTLRPHFFHHTPRLAGRVRYGIRKDGRLAFNPKGHPKERNLEGKASYTAMMQPGEIKTVDGKTIKAWKRMGGSRGWLYNCHGYSIGNGEYWIDNEDMQGYLKETTALRRTTSPRVGDLVVYRDTSGDVVHSALMAPGGKVNMAAGVKLFRIPSGYTKTATVPSAKDGWPGANPEYWEQTK
jgi:hypothetical protein